MTRTYFFTGLRPGELHALRVGSYREEHEVRLLDVREQYALPRKDVPAALAPLKTVWARRKIPVHLSLARALDGWLENGWKGHVGRPPKPEDFLFPDSSDAAYREHDCDEFLAHFNQELEPPRKPPRLVAALVTAAVLSWARQRRTS